MSATVENSVETATSAIREGVIDWGVNMEIVDMITGDPDTAKKMVSAVRARLKDKDPHVVRLAMTLLETAVKNGDNGVHRAVADKDCLADLSSIAEKGGDQASEALSLIEQWGVAFERSTDLNFALTYASLKQRGLPFSGQASAVPVVLPQAAPGVSKLKSDLEAVTDKVRLCSEMLAGGSRDDALSEVVGFLEACKPRLVELIEEGSSGALEDDLLAECFKVHDDLTNVLEAEAAATSVSLGPLGPDDEEEPALVRNEPPSLDLLDLNFGDEDTAPPVQPQQTPLAQQTPPPPPPQPDGPPTDLLL